MSVSYVCQIECLFCYILFYLYLLCRCNIFFIPVWFAFTVFLWSDFLSCTCQQWWDKEGQSHDDVIKWNHFPRYWSFVRGMWIPLPKASDAKLWCFLWSSPWVNNREGGDLRRHRAHYGVIVMNQYKVWNEIIYPFPTFSGSTVDVCHLWNCKSFCLRRF